MTRSGRFDTIGQNQSLSSLDLENYFEQAQEVVRTAMHWAVLPREEAKVAPEGSHEGVERNKRSSTGSWKRCRRCMIPIAPGQGSGSDRRRMEALQSRFEKVSAACEVSGAEQRPRLVLRQREVSRPGAHVTDPEQVQQKRRDRASARRPGLLPAASLRRCRRWSGNSTIYPHDGPEWTPGSLERKTDR